MPDQDSNYWKKLTQHRATRRQLLRGTAVGASGLAAAAIFGCGDDDDNTGNTTTATAAASGATATAAATATLGPVPGGTLKHAELFAYSEVLDPHKSTNLATFVWSLIGDPALKMSTDASEVEGELAESWEVVSDTELMMTVRPGVKWQNREPVNGREFDAEDLAYNLMRISGKLNPGDEAQFPRRGGLVGMDKAEAVDASNVKITFTEPASPFLNGVADIRNFMIPKDFPIEQFADTSKHVGSGPFMVESFTDQESAHFVKNPDYWRDVYLDGIDWSWLPDLSTFLTAFVDGQHDEVHRGLVMNPTQQKYIDDERPDASKEVWQLSNYNLMRINTVNEPLNDPRVRKALSLVLNYADNFNALQGEGLWSHTGPGVAAFPEVLSTDEASKLAGYNPATKEEDTTTAKAMMEQAGYPTGAISISILPGSAGTDNLWYNLAVRFQGRWKEVWPDMTVDIDVPPDVATFTTRQSNGDFDIIIYQQLPLGASVLEMQSNYSTNGARNYSKYSNSQVDSLLSQAFGQLDEGERSESLRQAEQIILDECPLVPLNMLKVPAWFAPKMQNVHGFGGVLGGIYDLYKNSRNVWFKE